MLLNVVHRKVHKNMTKKVRFRLASFAQKVVFGFPFMSWESLFYESNESISYESSYESALSAENTKWLPPQGFRPEGEIPRRRSSNSRVY